MGPEIRPIETKGNIYARIRWFRVVRKRRPEHVDNLLRGHSVLEALLARWMHDHKLNKLSGGSNMTRIRDRPNCVAMEQCTSAPLSVMCFPLV